LYISWNLHWVKDYPIWSSPPIVLQVSWTPEGCHRRVPENTRHSFVDIQHRQMFSQDTNDLDPWGREDMWWPVEPDFCKRSFFVLEEGLSVLSCYLINCDLHFAMIISSVEKMIFKIVDWLFTVLRPAQELFTYMETSPLPVKGCKI
jgi:hypothetical protein